jgi:ABC-type branched-subunit amino acid transport system substrate-binding protein
MPKLSLSRRGPRVLAGLAFASVAACGGSGETRGAGALTPGVVNDTIALGALVPLSDAVALIGKPILAGVETYFAQVNAKGGIGGKYKVKILAEDVTYANPSTSVQKYNKVKDQVAAFAMILGTDHVNVTLPLLAEDSLLAVPTTFDAEWVRQPQLIPIGAPYQLQVINGIDYWVKQAGGQGKTLCALTMATGYGEAALEGAQVAATALGTTVASAVKFRPGDQDFVAQVTQLKNAGCAGIVLASLPTETAKIMATAAQLGLRARWIGTSPTWHMALGQSPIAPYAKEHLWTVSDVRQFDDTSAAGMQAMHAAIRAHAPQQKPDVYFAAGYAFAQAVAAVLERAASSGDLSRAGIMNSLTELGTLDNGGPAGTYRYGATETREPPRATNIFGVDPAAGAGLVAVVRTTRRTRRSRSRSRRAHGDERLIRRRRSAKNRWKSRGRQSAGGARPAPRPQE